MIKLCLFLTLTVLTISLSKAWQRYDKCDLGYEKIDCFLDKKEDRALPEQLLNERDRTSRVYDGHYINWKTYNESLHRLACRCAAKTKEKGYKFFGLQFYGECWSGPDSEHTFSKYGTVDRSRCVQNIYSPTDVHCDKSKALECIGKQLTNYVYHIKEAPPSSPTVDGGYTEWSGWMPCSKTCGGGITTRSRTCTNPKPQNGGKDCSRLGEPEESKACAEDICPIPCKKALDIGIIIDGSSSVEEENFEKAREFFEKLVTYFTVSAQGTHFGVIVFSHYATLEFTMADSRYHKTKALQKRIQEIRYPEGGTRTDKALVMACNKLFTPAGGDRPDKPNVLIVFTDGNTNQESKPYPQVLSPLKVKGVETIAIGIGVGKWISNIELLEIAMDKPDNVIKIDNFDVLQQKLGVLLKDSCEVDSEQN